MGSFQDDSLQGISVIIVGAGYAGLSCACDLARRGVKVTIFEAFPELRIQGDIIKMDANATRLLAKWGGGILEEVMAFASNPDEFVIQDKMGKVLYAQPLPAENDGFPNTYSNRGKMQNAMYAYAIRAGVEFHFNSRVTEYFDTEDSAGVILDGKKYEADFVIAADGIRSKAQVYVTGKPDRPKKSGFAVFRAWFPLDLLLDHPLTADIAKADKAVIKSWITEDRHSVFTTNLVLRRGTCFATHKDLDDIPEDWLQPGRKEDMVKVVEGFDPVLVQIVKTIPPDCIIDYKLLWRDPVKPWVSHNGRVVLVGDSAHPHLPTSGTGAAQGIEDAATLGALLTKGGREEIPWVLRGYERLRFERTCLTQRLGWEMRHKWHQTDWDAVAKNPEWIQQQQPDWLFNSDADQYALDNYEAVISHLKHGTPFQSTNVPEGYVHEDWTVEDMMAKERMKADESFYKIK